MLHGRLNKEQEAEGEPKTYNYTQKKDTFTKNPPPKKLRAL